MKSITIYCFLLLYATCTICCEKRGDYIDFFGEQLKNQPMIKRIEMTSSNSFEKGYELNYKGCIFFIVLDSANSVTYASTNDKRFILDDSLSVGKSFSSLKKGVTKDGYYQSGWAYILQLKNGWSLGFFDRHILQNGIPGDTSKVKFIFRKK